MSLRIIKFGGSVITSRQADGLFSREIVLRLGKELPDQGRGCILIHGTGWVGKPPAITHGYLNTGHLPPEKNHLALEIKKDLRQLNQRFIDALISTGVSAHPMDTAAFFNEGMDDVENPQQLKGLIDLLKQGLTPVFYGDLIPVAVGGFKVFSSDVIALVLCRMLRPIRMLFLSDVPGVLKDGDCTQGDCYDALTASEAACLSPSSSDAEDVSGGMSQKIQCALEIARYCDGCFIGSGLESPSAMGWLRGERVPGTLIHA